MKIRSSSSNCRGRNEVILEATRASRTYDERGYWTYPDDQDAEGESYCDAVRVLCSPSIAARLAKYFYTTWEVDDSLKSLRSLFTELSERGTVELVLFADIEDIKRFLLLGH